MSFHIASDGNYVDEDKSYYALEGVVLNEKFTEDPKKYFEKKLMTAIFRKIWSKLSTKLDGLANMHTGNQIFIQTLGILNIQNTWSPTSNCTIFFRPSFFHHINHLLMSKICFHLLNNLFRITVILPLYHTDSVISFHSH